MRVFVAGASGVIGARLLPRLAEAGHEVTGTTRSEEKLDRIRELGAEGVVVDVTDRERLHEVVAAAKPDVILHQLTDLPHDLNPRNMAKAYEHNNVVRSEGTRNLVDAAVAAGARWIVAQNVAFIYAPEGGPVKKEDDPLYLDAPPPADGAINSTIDLERAVLETPGIDGVVLRSGFWYGEGTSFGKDGYTANEVRKRRYPVVGNGEGIFSFVHVDDVADATLKAMNGAQPGVYNVVDDEPAPVREWLPAYAEALGAKPPRHFPKFIGRIFAGRFGAEMMTVLRGASNEKAKRELGWTPRYSSWRQGFRETLA